MDRLGFLFDDLYLLHDPGPLHPESPNRLRAIEKGLQAFGAFERWTPIEPRPAHFDELELVHHASLIEHIEKLVKKAPAYVDADTVVCSESYRTALMAAGGVLECIDLLCTGELRRAFAFVRPPGHHAEPERAMGFCLFNNVALAAAYARVVHGFRRVAVVDFDLHHGNGTQACFYDNPHVLYVSSHQFPFYPGTGDFHEIGMEGGTGFTVNFPLPHGAGNSVIVPLYAYIIEAVLEQYRPELILVSAGFDAHVKDPLGGLTLTEEGYASIAGSLIRAADKSCAGKICFVLEGGYNLDALQKSAIAVMGEMERTDAPEAGFATADPLFKSISEQAKRHLGEFWKW